jgi:AcrR family transcriptional regulator
LEIPIYAKQSAIKNKDLVRNRRTQIINGAAKLFSKKGYHRTSVKEIAKASGISIGSLYDYIKNKEDILYLFYEQYAQELERRMKQATQAAQDPVEELRAASIAFMDAVDLFQEYVLFLFQESKYMKKRDLMNIFKLELYSMDFFIDIVKKGNHKYFSVKDPFLFGVFLSLLTCGWALKRWNLKKYKLKDYKEALMDFCLYGIRAQRKVGRGKKRE